MFNNINMSVKLEEADLKKLFNDLEKAIVTNKKEDFIKTMKEKKINLI